jgi:hypothetical protein
MIILGLLQTYLSDKYVEKADGETRTLDLLHGKQTL